MCLPHVPPFANAINSDSFSGVLNLVYNDTSYKTPVWQGFTRGVGICGGLVSVTLTFRLFEQVLCP